MSKSIPRAIWIATIVLALSIWLLAGSPTASAQSLFANLSGTVTDPTGAVVSGARVDVTNESTTVVRHFVTSSTGFFSVTELPTGSYSITVQAKGFEKWVGSGIVLQSSDNKAISIPLKVGAEDMTVTVTAGSDEIAVTDSGAKAEHIDTKDLERLSLVGRNAMEFLKTIPGAAQISNSGTNRSNYSGGAVGVNGFTVNGSAGGMSGVSINGQSNTGLSINQDGQNVEDPGGPGSATPVNPNPDMLSEVTIQTSNFGADNAKGPVVINSVSKSGGSTFHGSAQFYARNGSMNSEDAFNKAVEADPANGLTKGQLKIPSHYYYPGFNVGGPIIIPGTQINKSRNKYFFHESFENYRQLIDGGVVRAFVPTAAMVNNGDFSAMSSFTGSSSPSRSYSFGTVSSSNSGIATARPGCVITGGVMNSSCISSAAQLWMKDSLPLPTTPNGTPNGNGFNYVAPVQQSQNSTHNMLKVDIDFTESTKAYVSWSRQRERSLMPLGLWQGSGDNIVPAPTQTLGANTSDLYAANLVHVFTPTLTVEGRFGYTHMDMPGQPLSPEKVLRSQMKFPLKGVFGNPNAPVATSWSGGIPNIGDIGHDYHPSFYAEKGIPSAGGDLTKVYKTHTAKFGAFWENTYNAQDAWSQYMGVFNYNAWGTMSGNSYSDMLMGIGFSYYEQALPPAIKMSQNQLSFYGTDHWKINHHITVDYGMRFEHFGAGTPDTPYGDAVFNRAQASGSGLNPGITWHSLTPSVSKAGQSIATLVYSPRLGAAIDVFANAKTVVRGGWGQFRYQGYVVSNQGAANTAEGSVGWNAPGSANTWEAVDQFINSDATNGTSSTCAANVTGGIDKGNNHCAPVVKLGVPTDFTNGSVTVVDPQNHDQPYTTTYSLTIDQQLPSKFQFEVAYVGNHSDMGQASINLDYIPIGTLNNSANISTSSQGVPAAVKQLTLCAGMDSGKYDAANPGAVLQAQQQDSSCQQKYRPHTMYQGLSAQESSVKAQYDSFQVSLARSSGWLTTSLNYTWAKSLNNPTQAPGFKDYGTKEYWSVDKNNRGQTFNAVYVFALPKYTEGNAIARAALSGWEISGITQVMSGAQLTAAGGTGLSVANGPNAASLVGSPDVTVFATLTCNPAKGLKRGQYANPSCFTLPPAGSNTIGSGRFPYLAGPKFWSTDLSVTKNFKIRERGSLDLRFAAFNPLNHALVSFTSGDSNTKLNFDSNGVLTNATDTKNACPGPKCTAFGYPDAHYGYRTIETSAKFTF